MPKTDAQWQTEQDASTLVDAEKIKKDSKRLKAARAELKKRVKAAQEAMQES